MSAILNAKALSRDELAASLTQLGQFRLSEFSLADLGRAQIPSRGAIVGRWTGSGWNPFPELIVVRDDDYGDTLAWLASYFTALSPVTQWCRVIPQFEAARASQRKPNIDLGRRLGPWVGAILAECSAQANFQVLLRELPGTAALSTASFAAARAAAIWGEDAELRDLARRHDDVAVALRDGSRPVSASSLLPVWQAVGGETAWAVADADRRSIAPFAGLFQRACEFGEDVEQGELVATVVQEAMDSFDLFELQDCARGPQSDRVRALDRLATRLMAGPRSPAIDALLGFAASLIDPGIAILPDLLRQYVGKFPLAPIWLGAFAGAWSPTRVMSDHNGLGRLVAKALLADPDFVTRPTADVAYDELARWLSPTTNPSRLNLRGMALRTLSVELVHGVNCSFAFGRSDASKEATRPEQTSDNRQRNQGVGTRRNTPDATSPMDDLLKRLEKIEKALSLSGAGTQATLDLPEEPNPTARPKKTPAKSRWSKAK